MSLYGISQIKWDSSNQFVEQVKIHRLRRTNNEQLEIDDGIIKVFHDVSSLIHGGDNVYVLLSDGSGGFRLSDKVTVSSRQQEYLGSINNFGQPTSTLHSLVTFEEERLD